MIKAAFPWRKSNFVNVWLLRIYVTRITNAVPDTFVIPLLKLFYLAELLFNVGLYVNV